MGFVKDDGYGYPLLRTNVKQVLPFPDLELLQLGSVGNHAAEQPLISTTPLQKLGFQQLNASCLVISGALTLRHKVPGATQYEPHSFFALPRVPGVS